MIRRPLFASLVLALGVCLLAACSESNGPGKGNPTPLKFISIATHWAATCGISADSTSYCWGRWIGAASPELCDSPGNVSQEACSLRPLQVAGAQKVVALTGGNWSWCALDPTGAPLCWGSLIVDVDAGHSLGLVPTALAGGLSLVQVSSGWGHICGVAPGGEAYCWGDFAQGVRGEQDIDFDTVQATFVPNTVDGGLTFRSVEASNIATCGLATDGAVYCWGNGGPWLGNPSAPLQAACGYGPCLKVPFAVAGGLTFRTLTGGDDYYCGLTTTGPAYCWGDNSYGQLGNSLGVEVCPWQGGYIFLCATSPVQIELLNHGASLVYLEAGGVSTCGIDDSGVAWCWGDNSYGQLGTGGGSAGAVLGGHHFRTVMPGSDHTCGLTTDSLAYCWGDNNFGQLGDGTTQDTNEPVAVAGPASP